MKMALHQFKKLAKSLHSGGMPSGCETYFSLASDETRKNAIDILEKAGYVVDEIVLDVRRDICRTRAKALQKLDKVGQFITNTRVEK